MAEKLTETAASRTRAPATGQIFLWDTKVTGFGLRILPGGSRTFWFQYRPLGGRSVSSRMVRIGSAYWGVVARGEDPAASRQAARTRDKATLRTLLAEDGVYQRDLARRGIVNAKQAMSSLRRGFARLMSKEVAQLTRHDLVAAIAAIEDDGRPGAAQDLRKFARTFCEWCVGSGRVAANPLAGLRSAKRSRAERLKAASNGGRALSDEKIRNVWQAAGDKVFGSFGGLVRLALLTGLRRGELAQIERSRDVRADRIVVRPEHSKTGNPHMVPLTPLMREVIAGAPVTTSRLLFPSAVTGGRIKGWTKLVAKLQQASGADFRLHDLRRTARTLMSRLGVAEDIAELAIGHARADLVARYNKDEAWSGRSDAFTRVSDHVATLIGAREGAAVNSWKRQRTKASGERDGVGITACLPDFRKTMSNKQRSGQI